MINSENDIKFIGYGAMLIEGIVGILALIAAAVLNVVLLQRLIAARRHEHGAPTQPGV